MIRAAGGDEREIVARIFCCPSENAEIVRGAVQSVPTAQWEASESLAFNRRQTLWMIILPQCVKRMLPPWMNLYAILTMATVLASVIDCGLNTDDDVAETVVVDIDSDSETGVETITLTETSPASALFEGTIPLSTTDAAGGSFTWTVGTIEAGTSENLTVSYTVPSGTSAGRAASHRRSPRSAAAASRTFWLQSLSRAISAFSTLEPR